MNDDVDSVVKIQVCASMQSECERCPKCKVYRRMVVGPDTPSPYILLLKASPWEVVVRETVIGDHRLYIFLRCEDPTCLLVHLREGVVSNWITEQRRSALNQAIATHPSSRPNRQVRRAAARKDRKKKKA